MIDSANVAPKPTTTAVTCRKSDISNELTARIPTCRSVAVRAPAPVRRSPRRAGRLAGEPGAVVVARGGGVDALEGGAVLRAEHGDGTAEAAQHVGHRGGPVRSGRVGRRHQISQP